jgi:ABC-type transport system substrate-binding protein
MKTAYHSKGGRNFAQFADPQLDEMLDKAGRELDEAKRRELLRQAQMKALENYTFIGTIHYVSLAAFQPEARGMRLGSGTSGLQMYDKEVWLDK